MQITEVRVKLVDEPGERLLAFCSITFDGCFVVRDLKIIDGASGPFIAMPSRKLMGHCPRCRSKNHLKASYCNLCGQKLPDTSDIRDETGRVKFYADVAHPINSTCREKIQERVLLAYREEVVKSKQPGYVSSYDDQFDTDDDDYDSRKYYESPHQTEGGPHFGNVAKESPRSTGTAAGFGAGVFE